MKRIIALLLTVVMLFGAIMVDVGAYAVPIVYLEEDNKATEEVDYEATVAQYLTLEFKTPEEKLETMEMLYEKDGFQLWVDELTGEVATKNLTSGQILFSNPYDVGAEYANGKGPSAATKSKIMSQVIINYRDNDTDKEMNSFTEAAQRGQITIKNIKNGIRVEYRIGREETRMLVPRLIKASSLETKILDPFAAEINSISAAQGMNVLDWHDYTQTAKRGDLIKDSAPDGEQQHGNSEWFKFNKLRAFYNYKSINACTTDRERRSLMLAYPIVTDIPEIYVFAPDATNTELTLIESYIKTYVPSYTYEELEKDHEETKYTGSDKAPALFKLSLEYTLDEMGMSVRMPANGLRFNETLYQLNYLSILPYMGAGANYYLGDTAQTFTGYNFFPDGSGTLFRHEDLAGTTTTTINGKVYGQDFAYNTIVGSHQEIIRYPVFGVVTNYSEPRVKTHKEEIVNEETGMLEEVDVEEEYVYNEDRGFVAIIEEGDALAELSTYHAGSLSKYNTVQMLFYPRPKDSYNLANAISVGANATWTVVSSRKYVGNYKIRYIMLTDDEIAKENNIPDYYEASWMGMAEAYRDYLYKNDLLSELKAEDVKEDLPIYIQTFGSLETLQKILSIPVNVMTSLTSFENVKTMYDEFAASGVSNIKFKLVGYANGGMYAGIPYNLKWEKAVGGSKGYSDLLDYANEKGFEVFADFDFAYVRANTDKAFDGLRFKKHIVKSINNTYMSKRYYSATKQTYMGRYELAVSAAYYSHFYDKLAANLLKYYPENYKSAISVGTLGTDLNSDFDEDDPANRVDSRNSTVEVLEKISNDFDDVMTEGANAYAWKYVDYIVNVPLDSSRYIKSSAAVPFIGVVLHGSIQYAGTPLNMEGNIGYSLLKAIENGASLYFVLCYENYEELKEDRHLSEYYSVRYDILKNDVVKYYQLINDVTKDLQLSKITGHRFLVGERVPEESERLQDEIDLAKQLEEKDAKDKEEKAKELAAALNAGRIASVSTATTAKENVINCYNNILASYEGGVSIASGGIVSCTIGMKTLTEALAAARELGDESEERTAQLNKWKTTGDQLKSALAAGNFNAYNSLVTKYNSAVTALDTAIANFEAQRDSIEGAIAASGKSACDKIPEAYKAYAAAAAADPASQDTADKLAAVLSFADTIENAKAYTEAADALAAATAAKTAYVKELKTANDNAKKAADSLKKTLTDPVTKSDEYKAAKAELDAANAALKAVTAVNTEDYSYWNKVISTGESSLKNFEKTTPQYVGGKEYKDLVAVIDEAKAKIVTVEQYTPEYKEALDQVNAAQAKLDAMTDAALNASAEYLAAAAEYETAAAAYASDNDADGVRSEKFLALEKDIADATVVVDALKETIAANTPVRAVYEDFMAREEALISNYKIAKTFDIRYFDADEYKDLVAKDLAAFDALQKASQGYTNDAEYKTLKAACDKADAALVKYLDDCKAVIADENKDIADFATVESHDAFTYDAVTADTRALLKTLGTKLTDVNTLMSVKVFTDVNTAINKVSATAASDEYTALIPQVEELLAKPVMKEGEENTAKFDKAVDAARTALDDLKAGLELLTAAEKTGAIWEAKKAADAAMNEFLSKYNEKLATDAGYKAAKSAKDATESALKTYKNNYKSAYSKDPEFVAANDANNNAVKEMSDYINELKKNYSELGAALGTYDSNNKKVVDSEKAVLTAKADLDAPNQYAEQYALYYEASNVVTQIYNAVKIKSDAANADAKVATDLEKSIKKLNTNVSNNARTLGTYVAEARKALANAELANEKLANNKDYSEAFRKDVADIYNEVKSLEAEIHTTADSAIKAARENIELSKTVLPEIALEVKDPYAPEEQTDDPTEEKKEEDTTTKYTDNTGNIVVVTYENGVSIIENYNYFVVVIEYNGVTYTVPNYGGIRLNANGEVEMKFSAIEARIITD